MGLIRGGIGRVARYEFANEGEKPHRHLYHPKSRFNENKPVIEVDKINGKYVAVERWYCVYDGCGRYKQKIIHNKVCQACRRIEND